jgi:WD40 repeat protein
VHDLGQFESVVGSTAEGVLAVDTESTLVWIEATSSGAGDGAFTFERNGGPVTLPATGPVQSVALSADGRWLAWLDLEDVVTVYDLKAGVETQSVEVRRSGYVTSVSDRGVLVSEGGRLMLYGAKDVEVPTMADGYGWLSDTAGDLASVADRDDVTRVYDVTEKDPETGVAKLVTEIPGTGRLSAYGKAVVTVSSSERTDGTAWLWTDNSATELAGLHGLLQTAGWLDEDYALVTSGDNSGTTIYLCPVADRSCTPVAFSETDVRLAE